MRGAARVKFCEKGVVVNQKPLELMERVIRLSSEPGDLVWEPFGGAFTAAPGRTSAGTAVRGG